MTNYEFGITPFGAKKKKAKACYILDFVLSLQAKETFMLGIKTQRRPITGKFARKIHNAAQRAITKKYNKKDLEDMQKMRETLRKYDVVWEN